jgi:hypothetical protein
MERHRDMELHHRRVTQGRHHNRVIRERNRSRVTQERHHRDIRERNRSRDIRGCSSRDIRERCHRDMELRRVMEHRGTDQRRDRDILRSENL